jgi:hypothetical protein
MKGWNVLRPKSKKKTSISYVYLYEFIFQSFQENDF